MKKLTLVFFAFSLMSIMYGFKKIPTDNSCISDVQAMYKKMKLDDLDNGNVYINYTQITHLKQNQKSDPLTSTTTAECIVSKHQIHFKSNEIDVFMDSVDNFTVIPMRKMVFWSNSLLEKGKNERIKTFNLLQDSLFSVCQLTSCQKVNNPSEGYDKIIEVTPEKRAQKVFPYTGVKFYVNSLTQTIKKIKIDYLPQYDYTAIELIYNKVEKNYQKENLKIAVRKKFIASDNKLTNEFKNYKLVDNRAKAGTNQKRT